MKNYEFVTSKVYETFTSTDDYKYVADVFSKHNENVAQILKDIYASDLQFELEKGRSNDCLAIRKATLKAQYNVDDKKALEIMWYVASKAKGQIQAVKTTEKCIGSCKWYINKARKVNDTAQAQQWATAKNEIEELLNTILANISYISSNDNKVCECSYKAQKIKDTLKQQYK